MDSHIKDYHIARLRAGFTRFKYGDQVCIVKPPSRETEYEAQELYQEVYNEAIQEGLFTEDGIKEFLIERKMWSEQEDKELNDITPKHIEYWKVEIYNAYFQSTKKKTLRAHLNRAQQHLSSLLHKSTILNHYTASGVAYFSKNLYLFMHSCYDQYNKLIDFSDIDVTTALHTHNKILLNNDQLRLLAKTSPWSNMWAIAHKSGNKMFANDPLSIEQQIIIQWSCLYDNIGECPDAPPDDVIQDDDALDGWLIIQRRNREKNKVSSIADKKNDSGEIFHVVDTPEDAEKIRNMNNPHTLGVINSRLKQVQKQGIVKDIEFADVQQALQMKATQLMSQSVKRG